MINSVILTATIAFAYFWTRSLTLPYYSLTLIGFLIICYSIIHFISKKRQGFDVFFLSLITFLLVFSTGAINYPVFFLLYFLLFGVALLSKQLVEIQTGLKSILNDPQTPVVEKEKAKKIFGETYQVFVSGKEMEKKVEE